MMMSRHRSGDRAALLLTPKWIGLSLFLVALSLVFAAASSWQYSRAMDQVAAQRAAASRAVPLQELVPEAGPLPSGSLGRLAVVAGDFTTDAWIVGRTSVDGVPGVWLVSAVDDGTGVATAVLRGWLPQRSDIADPGPVQVTGRVSSQENFYAGASAVRPDELVVITDEGLAAILGQPLRPGYLVLTEQAPALRTGDPQPVRPVFGTQESVGFPWQNAGYAAQWIAFIAFVGYMYARFFADDLQRVREERDGAGEPAAGPVVP